MARKDTRYTLQMRQKPLTAHFAFYQWIKCSHTAAFCKPIRLFWDASSNTPQSALRREPRTALGSTSFTWVKTQPGQCRVRPDNTASLSSRPSKAFSPQTGELSDSVCTLQSTITPSLELPAKPAAPFPQSLSYLVWGKAAKSAVPC